MNEFKEIRFNATQKLVDMLMELLFTQQMLEDYNEQLSDIQRYLLFKHFEELKQDFTKEFKKSNKSQIKQVNELLDK